jgi:hypothetical protein
MGVALLNTEQHLQRSVLFPSYFFGSGYGAAICWDVDRSLLDEF